jgi:hypothetical protein
MEKLIAALTLEAEKDNDLLVYCMSDSATDIFKKMKDEGYYCSLMIGRCLMDSEMKFREFFSFEGHFPFHLARYKGRHNNPKLQLMADTDFRRTKAVSYTTVSK